MSTLLKPRILFHHAELQILNTRDHSGEKLCFWTPTLTRFLLEATSQLVPGSKIFFHLSVLTLKDEILKHFKCWICEAFIKAIVEL